MEALVRNTRLRLERGVDLASNGLGVLNGHTITCYTRSSLHPQSGIPYQHSRSHTVFFLSVRELLVADKFPSSLNPVTLMTGALSSSETSVLTRTTRRNIPEDGTLEYTTFVHKVLTLDL
jgi:hypothetical protein